MGAVICFITGIHTWVKSSSGGQETRTCDSCGKTEVKIHGKGNSFKWVVQK